MDELVKRLQRYSPCGQWQLSRDPNGQWVQHDEAAAALTEAQATIARLEAALRGIADATDLYEPCGWAVHRARAALSPGKGE